MDPNGSYFYQSSGCSDAHGNYDEELSHVRFAKSFLHNDVPIMWRAEMQSSAFTLPVISLVIITILNDGTMITISHDKVYPEKKPQKWAMFEVRRGPDKISVGIHDQARFRTHCR